MSIIIEDIKQTLDMITKQIILLKYKALLEEHLNLLKATLAIE